MRIIIEFKKKATCPCGCETKDIPITSEYGERLLNNLRNTSLTIRDKKWAIRRIRLEND